MSCTDQKPFWDKVINLKTSSINFIGYEVFPVYNFIPYQEVEQKELSNFFHVKLDQ